MFKIISVKLRTVKSSREGTNCADCNAGFQKTFFETVIRNVVDGRENSSGELRERICIVEIAIRVSDVGFRKACG